MKPAQFEYHRPESLADAAQLLTDLGDEAKVLAGGQSLVPMLSLRLAFFDHLIDISRLAELQQVEHGPAGTRIGAGITESVLEVDARLAAAVPLMARATPYIGH